MSEAVEDTGTDALRRHQIQLGIDPSEHPAVLGDLASAIAGKIAERFQHEADLVEVLGDGVTARVHSCLQPSALSLESDGPLGPARMGLALGAAMAWMMRQRRPAVINLCLKLRVNAGHPAALGIKIDFTDAGPEGSCQITPRSGVLGVEVLTDLHTSGDQRRCG